MRIIGNDQKNNGQNFWEILESNIYIVIGKILSIIGTGLDSLCTSKNWLVQTVMQKILTEKFYSIYKYVPITSYLSDPAKKSDGELYYFTALFTSSPPVLPSLHANGCMYSQHPLKYFLMV